MLRTRLGLVAMSASVVLAACSGSSSKQAVKTGDPTTAPTTAATSTAPLSAKPSPTASGGCPAAPPRVKPRADRSRYVLSVNYKPADNMVDGTVSVRFTPDLPTDRLVFRLWPNGPRPASGGAALRASGVSVGGRPGHVTGVNATTMEVRGDSPFAAGKAVDVSMSYQLTLPGPVSDRISRIGDTVRLGSFFPILAWEPGRGWSTEPPTAGFAEASVAATADFQATISVPPGFDVLATGVPDGKGNWSAPLVPDFAVSIGHFNMAEAMVNAPDPVKVVVGVDQAVSESPDKYLNKVVKVLADFGTRYGPYPWPAYTLSITPTLGGGIEYPMHVMQGPRTIGRTTSHEVAHEWFYGLVTNNQGRDPWLDEGLATWAEYRFEGRSETLVARGIPAAGKGKAGQPMTFWESRQSVYYESIYLQGAQAVAALGPADQVDCALRRYVAFNAHRVATPASLRDAVDDIFPGAAATLDRFGIKG